MTERRKDSHAANLVIVYNNHVQRCISIRVLLVDVGFLGMQQSNAFLLAEASGEAQREFSPVHVPTHRHRTVLLETMKQSINAKYAKHLVVQPFSLRVPPEKISAELCDNNTLQQ